RQAKHVLACTPDALHPPACKARSLARKPRSLARKPRSLARKPPSLARKPPCPGREADRLAPKSRSSEARALRHQPQGFLLCAWSAEPCAQASGPGVAERWALCASGRSLRSKPRALRTKLKALRLEPGAPGQVQPGPTRMRACPRHRDAGGATEAAFGAVCGPRGTRSRAATWPPPPALPAAPPPP